MQTVLARVAAVEGSVAVVELDEGGCGRCKEPGGCGGQNLSRAFCGSRRFRVDNPLGAQAGEKVRLGMDDVHVRSAANRAYLVPLGLMALGAFAGTAVSSMASAVGAFFGLAGGWLLLARWQRADPPAPRIVERLGHG